MQIAGLYLVTAVFFLAADVIMLRFVMEPLFRAHLGDMMLDTPRIGAAAFFYLAYVAGLVKLVSLPALRADDPVQALVNGAILGAVAYGTYEFTNYATLRSWSMSQVALDLAWGTILTAVSAAAGVNVMRLLSA